jgi:GNAT superfamily N-acetyltransferase
MLFERAQFDRSAMAEPCTAVAVDVTFLRMDRPPAGPDWPLPADAEVVRLVHCSVGFYRYLYHTVGHEHVWWLRRSLPDGDLADLLADPAISIHVLYRHGEPAGFYELDRRNRPLVNLAYFGLLPHAIGQGLGRALLRHAVDQAWAETSRGVTVNTCTADHPRALPNYLAAGFAQLRVVREVWQVPQRLGLPIPARLRAR